MWTKHKHKSTTCTFLSLLPSFPPLPPLVLPTFYTSDPHTLLAFAIGFGNVQGLSGKKSGTSVRDQGGMDKEVGGRKGKGGMV